MEKNKMKKTVWGASVAVALTTSTALGVSAYQSGIDFHPSDTEDTFRANQVRFDDTNDVKGRDNTTEQNESEFLEKDNTAQDGNRPQEQNNADYLFEREQLRQNFSDSIALNDGTADASAVGGSADSADTVYDFTDDRSQADIVINGSTGGTGDDNTGGGQGTVEPTQPTEPTEPEKPTQPTQPSKPSDNTDDSNNTTPDPTPADTEPTPGYGDASIDPDGDKAKPSFWGDLKDFPEDNPNGMIKGTVVIQQPNEEISTDPSAGLYSGQKNVSALTIYNALETYVQDEWETYNWGKDHFNKFVRIDAVWIDGKEYRFDSDQTIDIPEDAESIQIDVSYRLSTKDDWTAYERITYTLKPTRLLILNQSLKSEGQKIEKDMLLNSTKDANPKVNETIDLYSYQQLYLGTKQLTALFPGWKENGEFVPWIYTVTTGRHVLEPAPRVSLNSSYEVYVKPRWFDAETESFTRKSQNLTYMQTLTGYSGRDTQTLTVPKYVQAVDIADGTAVTSVDYLKLSDTVRYVNTDMKNMTVQKGYQVDGNNPLFAATKNGILTNAEGTEYLGIPYSMKKLKIPETITKVSLPQNTQIREIIIEATDADKLPEIDYGGMREGSIFVSDEISDAFISDNGNALAGTNISVRTDQQVIKEDAVYSADETLLKSVMSIKSVYTVQDTVTDIAENAFVSAPNVTTIVLPNQIVTLEDGCFADSKVDTVLCRTETQVNAIRQQLNEQGLSDVIRTLLLQTSREGASYYIDGSEAVLVSAEEGTTEFKGTETAQNGTKVEITAIAGSAFENNKTIQWVTLPEKVVKIGSRAFYNCAALEGILIETKNTITIENQAFDACPTLYFVASNAKNGDMDGYMVDIANRGPNNMALTQFIVTNRVEKGYTMQWQYFNNAYGDTLAVQDIGSTRMLYALDKGGTPRIAVRSGKTLEGEIKLADTIIEIYVEAMFGTEGAYTLNWDELSFLQYIDSYAFAHSGLEGSVVTNAILFDKYSFSSTNITELICMDRIREVDEMAFSGCKELTFVNWAEGFKWGGTLFTNLFYGCDKLTCVEFKGSDPPKLSLYSPGLAFVFNEDWTEEQEAEYIHIILPENDYESEQTVSDFVKAWRYSLLGFVGSDTDTAYQTMWDYVLWNDVPFGEVEDIFIAADEILKEKLTVSENRVRNILGVASVTEPSDFYPFRVDWTGSITLLDAPSDIVSVYLGTNTLEIPEDWCLDYIGRGAFSHSKHLESVMFDNGFAGFEPDAFKGVESDTLRLNFSDINPPALLLDEEGEPYTFGIDLDKLQISVFTAGDDSIYINYIEKWAYPLAGYTDYAGMYAAFAERMGEDATTEEIHAEMTKILLPIENQLRSIIWYMDMDFNYHSLPQVEELSFTLGTAADLPDSGDTDTGDTDAGDTDNGDGGDTDSSDGGDTDLPDGGDTTEDNDKNHTGGSGESGEDNSDSSTEEDSDETKGQEPVTLPDLSEERPVIIEMPLVPAETEDTPKEEPKEEQKEEQTQQPTGGEGESTTYGAEEGGTE